MRPGREDRYGAFAEGPGLGFVGVFVDEKYGGMGMGYLEACIVMEEFWRVDPAAPIRLPACLSGAR